MSLCASTCLVSLLSCQELWSLFDGSAAQNFKAAAKAALRLSAHAVCKAHSLLTCSRGDPSDEFRFATFFPEVVRGPIDVVARMFSRVFRLGLKEANGQPNSRQGFKPGSQPLPGSDTAEAARRRRVVVPLAKFSLLLSGAQFLRHG